jgi:Cdc6-like AAA superfamily ATPase
MLTEDQEQALAAAFRPHYPIEDPGSFFGRQEELSRVKAGIREPGQHVIIYGERGAGKTSLANVATSGNKTVKIFCEKEVDFHRLAKHIVQEYQKVDPERLVYDAQKDRVTVEGAVLPLSALDGNALRSVLHPTSPLILILDELDRIKNASVIESLGEFAKNVSTYQKNITLIFVGVALTTDGLLKGHASVFRNLKNIPLGRMEDDELKEIINHGEAVLGIGFLPDIVIEIMELGDNMPYYLHLIATNAARVTLEDGATTVEQTHLNRGIQAAARDADHTLREAYDLAVLSVKGSEIYRYILWALASRSNASHKIADLKPAVDRYAKDEGNNPVSVQAIGQALKALASEKKGSIVSKHGNFFHMLTHPLMKGYIRIAMRK